MAKKQKRKLKTRAVSVPKHLRTPLNEDVEEQLEIFIREDDDDDIVVRHKNRATTYMSVKGFMRELDINRPITEKVIKNGNVPVARTIRIHGVVRELYRLKLFFTAYLNTEGARQLRPGPGAPKKQRPVSLEEENLRLTKARADKAEIDLARTAGVVHLEEDVIKHVGGMLQAFRARALSIPTKAATVVPPEHRPEIEAAIKKIVYEALSEIASYRPDGMGSSEPTASELDAAGEAA